jgi:hypothetical protein
MKTRITEANAVAILDAKFINFGKLVVQEKLDDTLFMQSIAMFDVPPSNPLNRSPFPWSWHQDQSPSFTTFFSQTIVAGTGGGESRLRTVLIRGEEVLVDGQLLPAGGGVTGKNVLLQGCILFGRMSSFFNN